MDPTEGAVRRARRTRERADSLGQRVADLVKQTSELLERIDEHTSRRRHIGGGGAGNGEPFDPYPGDAGRPDQRSDETPSPRGRGRGRGRGGRARARDGAKHQ